MHIYDNREIRQCPECRLWFKPGMVSCAVLHYGKGCCHYGDTEMLEPEDDLWAGQAEAGYSTWLR